VTVADLDPREPAFEGTRRVLAELAATVEELIQRSPSDDPEATHDLRVALRRSRAVVAAARGVLPQAQRREARAVLQALAASTTPARDLEVLVAELDRHGAEVVAVDPPALELIRGELVRRRDRASALAVAAVRQPAASAWLHAWERWLTDPRVGGDGREQLGPVVAEQIRRAQRTVVGHGRAVGKGSPPEDLHRLRKDAKALRYLLEAYRPLLAREPAKALGARLRDLQDVLGAHQDAVTQVHQLTWLAGPLSLHGAPGVAALEALERLRVDAARRIDLHRAAFGPCFADYDTKGNRRSFTAMLDPVRARRG
jgi:CHAD domain-containing protein